MGDLAGEGIDDDIDVGKRPAVAVCLRHQHRVAAGVLQVGVGEEMGVAREDDVHVRIKAGDDPGDPAGDVLPLPGRAVVGLLLSALVEEDDDRMHPLLLDLRDVAVDRPGFVFEAELLDARRLHDRGRLDGRGADERYLYTAGVADGVGSGKEGAVRLPDHVRGDVLRRRARVGVYRAGEGCRAVPAANHPQQLVRAPVELVVAEGRDRPLAVVREAVEEEHGRFVQQQPGLGRRRPDDVSRERDERGRRAGIRHRGFEVRRKHRRAPGRLAVEVLPAGDLPVEVVDREDLDVHRFGVRREVSRECDGGESDGEKNQ